MYIENLDQIPIWSPDPSDSFVPPRKSGGKAIDVPVPKAGKDSVAGFKLRKGMGLLDAISMIMGIVIGSGIFVSPAGVVKETGSAGLALIVWLICGGFATLGAICYAELGTSILRSGGDFAYIRAGFGSQLSFLYLWVAIVVIMPAGNAITALTFANYLLQPLFWRCPKGPSKNRGHEPATLASKIYNGTLIATTLGPDIDGVDVADEVIDAPNAPVRLVAITCICFLIFINCYSVDWATKVQGFFTIAKLVALALIIGMGFVNMAKGRLEYLRSDKAFKGSTPHIGNFALSFYSGLFSYSGWNYLTFVTEELKDPYKNLPRAIFISLPIVTLVYVLTNLAYFTVLSPLDVELSKAVAVTFALRSAGKISWLIQLCVAASTFGGLNGCIFTSSRLFFVGAREGQLPEFLAMINLWKLSPIPSILFTGGITVAICVFSDVLALINYTTFVESFFMACSTAALMWLRFKNPELYRPIKINLMLPFIFLITCMFLLILPLLTSPMDCAIGLLLIIAGIPIYHLTLGWDEKPKFVKRFTRNLTLTTQKLFYCLPQRVD